MKSTDFTVAFHIGRGGRFYNQGHKSFLDYNVKLSDYCGNLFLNTRGSDGRFLPGSDWTLTTESGHIVIEGRDAIESETGRLDFDGDYDTIIVQYLSECSDSELRIVLDEFSSFDKFELQAVFELLSEEIEIYNEDGEVIYIGSDFSEIVASAETEEADYAVCCDNKFWYKSEGISRLKTILEHY